MAFLGLVVWLCAIGIFVGGIVRCVQRQIGKGLLLMAASVVFWLFAMAILVHVPA